MRVVDNASLVLFSISIFLVALASLMTPETFIDLGPLRRSLTSENDMVRSTALFEVALFRTGCAIAALLFLITAIYRKRLMSSRLLQKLSQHQPELSAVPDLGVFNFSLKVIAFLTGLALIFIFLAPGSLSPIIVESIIEEDGVVENVSAILFLVSSISALILLVRFKMPFRHRIVLALLAFCLFVFFGEEISWGQRIFGFDTLEIMREANVQNENNLHNLFGYIFPSLFLLAVIIYGFIIPFAAKYFRFVHQLLDLMGVPIASRGLAIGFLAAVLFRDWTFEKLVGTSASVPAAEIGEMLISVGFLLLMVEIWYLLADYGNRTDLSATGSRLK